MEEQVQLKNPAKDTVTSIVYDAENYRSHKPERHLNIGDVHNSRRSLGAVNYTS